MHRKKRVLSTCARIESNLQYTYSPSLSIICCVINKVRWIILEVNSVAKAFWTTPTTFVASEMDFVGEVSPLSHSFSAHSCKLDI